MFVKSFRVENYKSFLDSGDIYLQKGFNLICGRNNVGKSALIEPFNLQPWNNDVHRESSIPKGHEPAQASALFKIMTSGAEIKDVLLAAPQGQQFAIPRFSGAQSDAQLEIDHFFSAPVIEIVARRLGGGHWQMEDCLINDRSAEKSVINLSIDLSKRAVQAGTDVFPGSFNNVGSALTSSAWFSFKAERLAISDHIIQNGGTLAPDAQNLADVLHNFSLTRRKQFENYIKEVSAIIPNLDDIVVRTILSPYVYPGQLQTQPHPFANISIRLRGAIEGRDDLSFALKDSGTGVSQVLSVVYVIIASIGPKLIVIDEPNSFLNPGAVRALMELMERYGKHQYIVTTHSAEIISTPSATISLVTWENERSQVATLSSNSAKEIKNVLSEVGVQLSDVFGADEIVWVEGPTEAECFPLIMKHLDLKIQRGTKIIPVASATEIAKNTDKARLVVDIYERLASANAIIPPAVAISLDKENFSDEQISLLSKRLGGKVHFLDRRCIENYLISPAAISSVLEEIGFTPQNEDSTLKIVQQWFDENAKKTIYKTPITWSGSLADASFLIKADGAKLLSDLFSQVTDHTHVYIKTRHSAMILGWLLANDDSSLKGLIDHVKTVFGRLRVNKGEVIASMAPAPNQ